MRLPAICESCRLIFPSRFGPSGNIEGLYIAGCSEPCPRCKRPAKTLEGAFNVHNSKIELIGGPEWSHKLIERLAFLLDEVSDAKTDRKSAVEEIRRISPEAGAFLSDFIGAEPSLWKWMAALLIFMMTRCSMTIDGNKLLDQVLNVSHVEESQDLKKKDHDESAYATPKHSDPKTNPKE